MPRFKSLKETILKLLQYRTSFVGLLIVLAIAFLALGAPIIASRGYAHTDPVNRLRPPSAAYLFGTDVLGRDLFSRIIYGAQIALWVGLLVTFIEAGVGVTLGIISGYYSGIVDKVISAVTDMVWAFPPVVLALGVVTMIGPGLTQVVVAIALTSWPSFTRIARAKVQSMVNREFVLAARAIGESDRNVMARYLLPNLVPSILVLSTLTLPAAILYTTALSFLGFGAQPPTPDWGAILADGAAQLRVAPWIATFPGIFIVITALGFNLLGDGLRDILDPKLRI
jgi:peptide/nickel transport system permease protein